MYWGKGECIGEGECIGRYVYWSEDACIGVSKRLPLAKAE